MNGWDPLEIPRHVTRNFVFFYVQKLAKPINVFNIKSSFVITCLSGAEPQHIVILRLSKVKEQRFSIYNLFLFIGEIMGVGLPLVRLGWRPPGLSVPLPPFSSSAPQNPEDFS